MRRAVGVCSNRTAAPWRKAITWCWPTRAAFERLVADDSWPLLHSRGQVTWLPAPADWRPALPIAGDGYAIPLPHGQLMCGATSDLDDPTRELREVDHRRNLAALQRLSGRPWLHDARTLGGRVAWRLHARDRLPLLGGVPLPAGERARAPRQEQPRFVARQPGLYVLAGLGVARPDASSTGRRTGRGDDRGRAAAGRAARCSTPWTRPASRRARCGEPVNNAASPPLARCPAGTGWPGGERRCRPSRRPAIG